MELLRWQQIDRLLQAVLERLPAEREAYLDEACHADKHLRQAVESLLSFQKVAETFLEGQVLADAAEMFWDDETELMSGQVIGSYKIETLLGSGGMGDVYLAEDTKLERKVAIKFLPTYLEQDELAKRRLIREAKAAAKLDHPNICAVYEVKEEFDRSFIVMQYVAGRTLADRIKKQTLDLGEALDICIQVVEGLAEAHSRAIIHRDIKPGNIMITARQQVKVLDFGLAKFLESEGEEQGSTRRQSILSRSGERPGTPPYMSPEQIKGSKIDARSDLFAAGVMLYECLTGQRPFAAKTEQGVFSQVIGFDPPQPSKLNSALPAELDRIVIKALAKEPEARYQSATDLLADLRAFRKGMEAHDGLRAFILAAISVALSLAVLAYSVVPKLLAYRAPPEALRWYNEGTKALRNGAYYEASKALQQAIGIDDRFALAHARLAEAYIELDYTDRAKDQIIRAESLTHELWLQPADALYLKAVSNTVLRDFSPAIQSYQQIANEASDHEKANVYLDLGRAYEKNDELEKAKENYQAATKLAPQEAPAFLRLGIVCSLKQDFSCAGEAFQRAESLYQALGSSEGVGEVFYQRGFLFIYQVKLLEARADLDQALQMAKTTGNAYQQIKVLQALSNVSSLEGHITQAEHEATEAIQSARDNGTDNQAVIGLIWLGNAYLNRGNYYDAEHYYQQALELAQRNKMRLSAAWALTQMGSLRSLQHKTEEALQYTEKAVAFYRQSGYHKWLALTLPLVGRAYRDRGNYQAALKAFEDQLKFGEQLGDQSQVGLADVDIGNLLLYEEQYPKALSRFDESYGIFKSLKAELYAAYAAQSRASVLWQLGRSEEARAALEEATATAEQAERPKDIYKQLLANIYLTSALLELSQGNLHESKVKSRKALGLSGDQYPAIAVQATHTLALAHARSGAARAAELLSKEAIDIAAGMNDPQLLSGALLASAEALLDNGKAQAALEAALRAQESFARYGKSDSEWRAWLIAAEASRQLRNDPAWREYASFAKAGLSMLEQKWGAEVYQSYLVRSDITRFRKQLEQVVKK